jgi:hypothetical protein
MWLLMKKFLFQIYVIDKLTGARLRTLQRHKNGIRCIQLRFPLALSGSRNSASQHLVVASASNDEYMIMKVYNNLNQCWTNYSMKFYHIFSPGSRDKTAILWNLESGRCFDDDVYIFTILGSARRNRNYSLRNNCIDSADKEVRYFREEKLGIVFDN